MKKKIAFIISLLFLCGCQSTKQEKVPVDVLTGSAKDVLQDIVKKSELEIGMTFDEDVTEENCESILGITKKDYNQYVLEAYSSVAAITTQAHLTAVVKCKDMESSKKVKELIANSFDSSRWICVAPDESFVVESGSYVFLVSSFSENIQLLKTGFESIVGESMGEIDVFFQGKK